MDKGIGLNIYHHELASPHDLKEMDIAHRGRGLTTGRPKGAEVLFAQQTLRLAVH
jgi:hypothetical protein